MKISKETARRLVVGRQGFPGSVKFPAGKEGVARIIEHLGFVQIDTIAVVERAHHHVLWSRQPAYVPGMLEELLAKDRRVFEAMAPHVAAYIPMRDYRFFLPLMHSVARRQKADGWCRANAKLLKTVKSRIRREGPLCSADFDDERREGRGGWWNHKPAKRALETLFWWGELMISERRNFRRYYDLTERVLPARVKTSEPDKRERALFAIRRVLNVHGIATLRDLKWQVADGNEVGQAAEEAVEAKELTRVEVDGLDEPHFAFSREMAKESARRAGAGKHVHILSPFDNLVLWQGGRRRLRLLFDYDYVLGCYFRARGRKCGYFELPILWGTRFVGRMDSKADRAGRTLLVHKLTFEPTFRDHERIMAPLAAKLRAFAAFNGCDRVAIGMVEPKRAASLVKRRLGRGPTAT